MDSGPERRGRIDVMPTPSDSGPSLLPDCTPRALLRCSPHDLRCAPDPTDCRDGSTRRNGHTAPALRRRGKRVGSAEPGARCRSPVPSYSHGGASARASRPGSGRTTRPPGRSPRAGRHGRAGSLADLRLDGLRRVERDRLLQSATGRPAIGEGLPVGGWLRRNG